MHNHLSITMNKISLGEGLRNTRYVHQMVDVGDYAIAAMKDEIRFDKFRFFVNV